VNITTAAVATRAVAIVPPVGDRGRRGGADQHVADHPAAEGRGHRDHEDADEIKALAKPGQGAGHRGGEDAEQVEDDGEMRVGDHDVRECTRFKTGPRTSSDVRGLTPHNWTAYDK
jgi:hypothetical protein